MIYIPPGAVLHRTLILNEITNGNGTDVYAFSNTVLVHKLCPKQHTAIFLV
jgi:hypothetical protein